MTPPARQRALGTISAAAALTVLLPAQAPDWTSRSAVIEPPGRVDHGMAYDAARQRVVLFGGNRNQRFSSELLYDTWEWDGTSWAQMQPANSPPYPGGSMAYDAARRQVLLWSIDSLWTWDGTNWSMVSSPVVPSLRGRVSLAYDSARQRVVMFGGAAGGTPLTETWEWDGSTWIQSTPQNSPPRSSTGWAVQMTYDESRGGCVFEEGDTTWLWDGTDWSSVATGGQYIGRAIVYDRLRQRAVTFGGSFTGYYGGWTWSTREWVNGGWVVRNPTTHPEERARAVAVWDDARGEVFLFGGSPFDRALLYPYWNGAWVYQTVSPASFSALGAGCAGTVGTPSLAATSLPWTDSSLDVVLTQLPAGNAAALMLGSSSSQWGVVGLPLDLAFVGMTGCSLRVSLDLAVPLANPGGAASLSLPIAAGAPAGAAFYLQGLVADPGANPLGATVSGGARATIGVK